MIGHLLPDARRSIVPPPLVQAAAEEIAEHYDLSLADVTAVIASMPDAFRTLLGSAPGWSAVGEYVSQTLGGSGDVLIPTIH
jgi:hypothetical protein